MSACLEPLLQFSALWWMFRRGLIRKWTSSVSGLVILSLVEHSCCPVKEMVHISWFISSYLMVLFIVQKPSSKWRGPETCSLKIHSQL